MKNKLYFDAFKVALLIAAIAVLGRFGDGAIAGVLLLYGSWAALTRRRGIVLSCFMLFPILLTLNPIVFPMAQEGMIINRISTMLISLIMVLCAAKEKGRNQLPLGAIAPYLLVATISSIQGYFPEISYMKMLNFIVFLLGIWIGTRNIQNSANELLILRTFLMGIVIFIILGSLLILLIAPGAAYFQSVKSAINEGGVEFASQVLAYQGTVLLSGITNQSQCLGPTLAALNLWVVCDMLLIERRFAKVHVVLFVVGVVLMYLTRSRTSLIAFLAGAILLIAFAIKHTPMTLAFRKKVRGMVQLGVVLMIAAAAIFEIRNHGITRWLRKSDDIVADDRSFVDAVTNSRQGLIDEDLRDFSYNRLLGCGFQVAYRHKDQFAGYRGLILSAPIEKGVLPLMVLGESGIVGFIFFMGFIFVFYTKCAQKKLFATLTLFTVMFASNFGEADFWFFKEFSGTICCCSMRNSEP